MLKLDFAKAFDLVDWNCLQLVLEARGFPPVWNTWMHNMLQKSKLVVLVNGVPGP